MATLIAAGIGAAGAAFLIFGKRFKKDDLKDRSTTSSAGGGAAAYETVKAVDEYLQFHFGTDQDIMPYSNGPKEALKFPARCAALCERHCAALQDITGERGETLALDIGCAVGGATFELARSFSNVLGIDYSQSFVDAAQEMKEVGSRDYIAVVEGEITRKYTATVPSDIERARAKFMQGDACALPSNLSKFDAILAANLVCRLPEPMEFFERLPSLVKPGGVAVIISPHSWLPAWTPKSKWIGGYNKDGKPVYTASSMTEILSKDFDLIAREDMPFLIREHARKFQWGCSNAMVWRRKAD
ncbi:hypothetical protein CEUSTIGMA_g10642.t1 [Chlamydomonas eustigma]|uniref:Methyltransferase type 11 domain-containing protein n=1 Tax=Chlamydomonas eustigma TaxID=1157962 RepID=A0A250XJL9_9CHLO|nr:hypothetical protein CEUSTIGMA_g10642.t1 [Chlamydomonas eustigma]|eukprot:GAX83216.1 hypothetical protein CEUSTIGMA_g10642.t1 [Chlamydomonas eustigma]